MKKLALIVLTLAVVFAFTGCQEAKVDTPQNLSGKANQTIKKALEGTNTESVKVTLYFINQEYVITGDESLEKLIAVERVINTSNKSLGQAVLEELQKSPEDNKLATSLENLKILSVNAEGSTAFVNLSSQNLYGGSMQEMLVIDQIVYSLTELDEITQVQFLIDGNVTETLMGHIETTKAFKR